MDTSSQLKSSSSRARPAAASTTASTVVSTSAPPGQKAASASASSAAAAAIRRAAEEKARQLWQTRQAKEQWAQWVRQVQFKLIQTQVDASTLRRAALVLRPSEYEEVVEERAVGGLCAFPTCPKRIDDKEALGGGGKKYQLSLKAHRVYDVSGEVQFCSQDCRLHSELYKEELSEEPFYLRQVGGNNTQQPTPSQHAQKQMAAATTAAAKEEKEESAGPASALATSAAALPIVEKENSVSHSFAAGGNDSQGAGGDRATAAAFVVEGYQPKFAVPAALAKKDKATASVAASETTATQAISEKAKAKTTTQQPSATSAPSTVSSSDAAPSSVAPAPSTANSATTTASSTTAVSLPPPATTKTEESPSAIPASSAPEFLPFTPLPAVLESMAATPLSRSEFEALTPEQQLDYLGQVALQESKKAGLEQGAFAKMRPASIHSAPAASIPAQQSSEPTPEKKIRRRKTAAQKEAEANAATNAADAPAQDGKQASPSPAMPASSPSASVTSSSSSTTRSSSSSSSSRVPLCDDPSDPIITPAEIQSNLSSIRNATLPPFVLLLQCFMRWATPQTHAFIRQAQAPKAPTPASLNRARHTAFLTLVQQHWRSLSALLQIRHPLERELQELTDTFSFEQPIPPLRPEQWRCIALLLVRAVASRQSRQERRKEAVSQAWTCMQPLSMLAEAPAATPAAGVPSSSPSSPLLSAITLVVQQAGFGLEQMESLFQTFMLPPIA